MMADKLSAALPAQLPAYWTKALSMTGGPMVERNLRTAIAFFLHYYRDIDIRKKLPSLFKGIDWHQPVQVARLQKGATVAAFRRVEMATNLSQPMFFTKPGTSPLALGIVPGGRVYCQYVLQTNTEVLESRVSSFIWTGGSHGWQEETRPLHYLGAQYIIPVPWKNLDFQRSGSRVQQ